jgi:uncharacterized membrane protein YkvA (DUF1232 family)
MDNLNESDQERVSQTFEKGVETFTEEDLEKVKADAETAETKAKFLGGQFESFQLTWSLLQDYWAGKYTSIPWKLIASTGFAVAYLVSPLDIIPDFLPIIGFVDDASVFALVVSSFQSELSAYKKWKKKQE